MPNQFPYYNEPTHNQGDAITLTGPNAGRDTSVSAAEGRLIVDAVDKIFLLEPSSHPLTTLLTNVGKTFDGKTWKGSSLTKAETGNPEFSWFEDFYGGRYARVASSYNTSDDEIEVVGAGSSSAFIFTVGDVIKNSRTGENMFVKKILSPSKIEVSRSFGTTAAAAGSSGDGIFIIGNASEENGGARNTNTTQSLKETNYTQIFKTTIGLSGTEKEARLYGGKDLPYQRAKKGTEHALDIERAFWWGEKAMDFGVQGKPRRQTGGVAEFIQSGNSYIQNQGGVLTAPDLNTFLREGFTYGNNEKMLFAGGQVIQAINEIARGQITTKPLEKTYGMLINEWVTSFGKINIVHNPLFVEEFSGYAFLLDMECFRYRYMSNRDTKLHTNVQANDADGVVDQYITEAGLERKQAPRHALLKGVIS